MAHAPPSVIGEILGCLEETEKVALDFLVLDGVVRNNRRGGSDTFTNTTTHEIDRLG